MRRLPIMLKKSAVLVYVYPFFHNLCNFEPYTREQIELGMETDQLSLLTVWGNLECGGIQT